ncbi:MAG: hypothetical protein JWL64_1131, partial [Frankiales bacterium]|nr:hypothetical protein [Frankiales bacterium]
AGLVEVDRQQSVADRLRGRSGVVTRLSVSLGDRRYVLHPRRGAPRAEVVHVVKGLALDHDEVSLDVWTSRLAAALTGYAADSARTAELLARVTDPGGAFD